MALQTVIPNTLLTMSNRGMITKSMALAVKKNSAVNVDEETVKQICESLFTVILDDVKRGKDVTITNFVKFKRVVRKERTFKNPNNSNLTTKPERYAMTATVMSGMKKVFEAMEVTAEDIEVFEDAEDADSEATDEKAEHAAESDSDEGADVSVGDDDANAIKAEKKVKVKAVKGDKVKPEKADKVKPEKAVKVKGEKAEKAEKVIKVKATKEASVDADGKKVAKKEVKTKKTKDVKESDFALKLETYDNIDSLTSGSE